MLAEADGSQVVGFGEDDTASLNYFDIKVRASQVLCLSTGSPCRVLRLSTRPEVAPAKILTVRA
jgi:hypothetical protein